MFELKPMVRHVLLACGGVGAVVLAGSAFAQPVEEKETVVITGTRLVSPNIVSNSPITTVTAEEIKTEGVRNVEDILNRLPQVMADQGSNASNGSNGVANVNLRGLGSNRTLVLMNGRRLPPGTVRQGSYAADLNQIPAGLIQRVEILTGGASAVYGSDAVAGVVNFIMNDRFEGVQAEWNHSFYNHEQKNAVADIIRARNFPLPGDVGSDGETNEFGLLVGGNFAGNKGNATVFLGYKEDKAVLQANRDYSACALLSTATTYVCGGSSTSFPGRFIDLNTGASWTVADAAGNVRPFLATDLYNYGPLNYYQRPSERYTFAAFAHYDVAPFARAYSEIGFHDDRTVAQIAPSGLFGLQVAVPFENPLLSPSWRSTLGLNAAGDVADVFILRRNVEGGGRQDHLRHTSYRGVVGVKGEFAQNWNYDLFAQIGRVVYQDTYKNDFSRSRAARAMDVVTDPTTGQPVCRSALDGTDPNCVPYNIWRLGAVTPAAIEYLQTPGFQSGFTSQKVYGFNVSSDLGAYGLKIPTAQTGVSVLFGAERRSEQLSLETDLAFSTNDLFGQGGATIGRSGKYSVKEYYAEGRVPIIEGRPFAEVVGINASVRYSDYSTGVSTDTYGLGLEWQPVKAARLRGSYQRAVRAANINELFLAQGLNLFDMDFDPCAGSIVNGRAAGGQGGTFEQCARTGVTAAQFGNIIDSAAGQYNFLQGGNPQLQPEEGTSKTLGLVLTPTPNISATIDYFDIEVKDVISTLPPALIVQRCIDAGQFCNLIRRDSLGTLWATPDAQVIATNQNLSRLQTSGLDVSVNYNQSLGRFGRLNLNFVGTYLEKFISEPVPGLGDYDCAGLYGNTCGVPNPEWRHRLRGSWLTPWNVELALTWRHFDKVLIDTTSSNPLLAGSANPGDRELGARDYIDVAATWTATKWLTVRAGINNLFDRDPPLTSQSGPSIFGNGNTFPQVYDALGRRIFLGLTAKF